MKINWSHYENDIANKIEDKGIDISENILNWYSFKKNSNILNIGESNLNYISYLCNVSKSLTTIQFSKKSAEDLENKTKNIKNLDIYVGNFSKMKFRKKFDYIILYGVLELTTKLFDNGINELMDKVKKLLNIDGKIIIINENPYGIKYFADNYTENYEGFKYNITDNQIDKYGKNEIINVLKKIGFSSYQFYYPFPDYKNPIVIYSDFKMPTIDECYSLPIYNYGYQTYLFEPRIMMANMLCNNMFDFFSNSYIVEIGNKKELSEVAYIKHQPYRTEKYKTITLINKDKTVKKIACTKQAEKHLKSIEEISKKIQATNTNTCLIKYNNNVLDIEYVDGKSIYNVLSDYVKTCEKEKILNEIDNYIKFVISFSNLNKLTNPINESLYEVYKDKKINILKVGLLDFNMGNVIKNKNDYTLIDQEWYSDLEIPSDYVIYFSIKLLFESIVNIDKILNIDELLQKYGITPEMPEIFDNISINYFNDYIKLNDLEIFKYFKNNSSIHYNSEVIDGINKSYQEKIDEILNSTSWKITKPLRKITEKIKK